MKKHVIFIWLFLIMPQGMLSARVIRTETLLNGMRIIHKRSPANDVVALQLFMTGGLREEPETKAGITMLMQSLLTRGTRTRTAEDIALAIESVGGDISSSASEDFLLSQVVVTVDSIQTGLELLSDITINPLFPQDEFEKEKKVQINAIRARTERIFTVALDTLNSLIFVHHPYGRTLQGTEETLHTITRDDVEEWYSHKVYPQAALLVIVGNCTFEEIMMLVKQYFSSWDDSVSQRPMDMPVVVGPISRTIDKTFPMDFKQSFLMQGYLMPNSMAEDYEAVKLVNEILGGGMSRRLFQKFREEKPYAYEAGCFYPTRVEHSSFVLYLGLDKKNLPDAQKEFQAVIDDLARYPVSDQELADSKTHLIGSYIMAHQSNSAQAWYLGWWEIVGRGYAYDELYPQEIERVLSDDIQSVARKYFSKNRVAVIIQGTE